jgi:FkbM family methyltransferase
MAAATGGEMRRALVDRAIGSRRWGAARESLPFRLMYTVEAAASAADVRSFRELMRYKRWDLASGPVRVRLRPLAGNPVLIRPATTDMWAATAVLPPACHLPPPQVEAAGPRVIWDLGANIGVTMAHMAVRHPRARIVGVELDEENCAMARANVARFGLRCEVLHAGVWPGGGEVEYRRRPGEEVAFHLGAGAGELCRAPGLSLDELLSREVPGTVVDYVKMDVEGAERELLRRDTAWAASARCIKVEVHEPYTVEECVTDLESLGFSARVEVVEGWKDGKPPVVGTRGL